MLSMPRWLLWTVAAMLSWGVWAILAKVIGNGLTGAQSQVLSALGFLPVILALCVSRKRLVRTGGRWGMFYALAAGAVSGLGNLPYYDLLSRGEKAAAVVPLTALAPLVTVVLAVVVSRERLGRIQLVGVALSLVAIYLFNVTSEYTEGNLLSGWLAYALIPMAAWGLAGFLSKLATGHLSGELAALLVLLGFVLVSGLMLIREPLPSEVSPRLWMLVFALGLTLAFGNYAVVVAYSTGKASIITPLAGLYMLVSVPIAVSFLEERIELHEWISVGCAVAAVFALSMETALPTPHEGKKSLS
jgi:transporter family protein